MTAWQDLDSTMIEAASYDPERKRLSIRFKARGAMSGKIYHYADVPAETVQGLLEADSAGNFFHATINGQFTHQRS